MTFENLDRILTHLNQNRAWQKSQKFQQLLSHWPEIVGIMVAGQTRPLKLDRQVLRVATSNASWAQNLQFERHRILDKINQRFALDLVNIHFSTAQWLEDPTPLTLDSVLQEQIWQQHPSRVFPTQPNRQSLFPKQPLKNSDNPKNLESHFKSLSKLSPHPQNNPSYPHPRTNAMTATLLPCPQCQRPTPVGELKRWSMCGFCITKHWA
jgi:predicted nucleic acid-binding Zn ribbon protein